MSSDGTESKTIKVTPKITTNTVLSYDLPSNIDGIIKKTLGLDESTSEKLDIVYIYSGNFDENFDITKEIIVGFTSSRIFKIQDAKVDSQFISNIIKVSHQKNGMFRWDKVEVVLRTGGSDTFGIWHSDVCKYFCTYLEARI